MINGYINAGIHGSWLLDPETILIRAGDGNLNFPTFNFNSIGINWLDDQIGTIKFIANSILIFDWPTSLQADSITFESNYIHITSMVTSYADLYIKSKINGPSNRFSGNGTLKRTSTY